MFNIKYIFLSILIISVFQTSFGQWLLPENMIAEIDASAYSPEEGSIVFFSANAVQYYSLTDTENEPAFDINSIDNMPAEITGIDGATLWDMDNFLLFSGQDYFIYDLESSTIIETNSWDGLPVEWKGGLDAICYWEEDSYVFFYANEFVFYDRATNTYSEVGIINNWDGWPENWEGFSSAVNIGNGIIYFFRDGEFLTYDIETKNFEGPVASTTN